MPAKGPVGGVTVEPSPLTVRSVRLGGSSARVRSHANLIRGIAELLRGDYKWADYGKVVLPFVVMRRLDQVLEDRRDVLRSCWS